MDKAISHGDFGIMNCLPLELWYKILRLLPVRSLVTLSTVNKSFSSVIHSPDFAPFHLQSNYNPRLINVNCFRQDDATTFYGVPEMRSFTGILSSAEMLSWYISGSINGLLLLTSNHTYYQLAVLWNPSIRNYRAVRSPITGTNAFALGYDRSIHHHKILATSEREAWLYTDSWTEITFDADSNFRRYNFGDFRFFYDDTLSFQNGAVWTQSDYTQLDSFELVWFDFEAERFHYSEKMARPMSRRGLMVLDGGCTVGLWGLEGEGPMTTFIWALEKGTMTWQKRYEIPFEMVPYGEEFETVRFEECEGELVWKYRLKDGEGLEVSRYRVDTNWFGVEREGLDGFEGGFVTHYVDSLFMLR